MPFVSPVTKPDVSSTVKMPISLLLHVPPPVASLSVQLAPSHTTELPEIGAGSAFTVTYRVL